MPLPPNIDRQLQQRFQDLILQADALVRIEQTENRGYFSNEAVSKFYELKTSFLSLLAFLPQSQHLASLSQTVRGFHSSGLREISEGTFHNDRDQAKQLYGLIVALKNDYESGMLDNLAALIEANMVADYLGQAEQLLEEGQPGKYDHVPAAVLTGAILENALRLLSERQVPPIDILKPSGEPRAMDSLITDLAKAQVFNNIKADQLRSWAKTRNAAAHGEFAKFNRQDIEQMLVGVRNFLADYL